MRSRKFKIVQTMCPASARSSNRDSSIRTRYKLYWNEKGSGNSCAAQKWTCFFLNPFFGMVDEDVYRLANRKGIPKTEIVHESSFSKAWTLE